MHKMLSKSIVTFELCLNSGFYWIGAKDDGGGGDLNFKLCKAPVKSSLPTNQHPVFARRMLPNVLETLTY